MGGVLLFPLAVVSCRKQLDGLGGTSGQGPIPVPPTGRGCRVFLVQTTDDGCWSSSASVVFRRGLLAASKLPMQTFLTDRGLIPAIGISATAKDDQWQVPGATCQMRPLEHCRSLFGERRRHRRCRQRGFSAVELLMVMAVGATLAAMAVPQVRAALNYYRLRGAVANATWAIQSARYQALAQGYSFRVAFDATTSQYQLSSQPAGAAGFSNVGTPVPLSGSPVTLNTNTTLQFRPNGAVTATTGGLSFTVAYSGLTKTVTVSNYGNITVTP
jgi:prepilin-type N-terminal cleavage/methylation domain-containing protein